MKYIYVCIVILCFPTCSFAQEVYPELQETVRAEVISILNEHREEIVGTDTKRLIQEIEVRVKEGVRRGDTPAFENDLMELTVGDSIYVNRLIAIDGTEYYQFKDVDRRWPLGALVCMFVLTLIALSGWHGVRALAGLILSIGALFCVLVPLLLNGYNPVLASVTIAGCILTAVILIAHGLRPQSYIALLGTWGAVLVTGVCAYVWTEASRFTGLSDDAAIYLNFSTKGTLDFGGLLLGSIIIGMLGVLDDVAITQASVVRELQYANGSFRKIELYRRALRVGRDHIGSLVNTLAFAYLGAALPLILLFAAAGSDLALSLNQEVVAVELVRIFVGSIGLILTVPITTAIAVLWYSRYPTQESDGAHTHYHH